MNSMKTFHSLVNNTNQTQISRTKMLYKSILNCVYFKTDCRVFRWNIRVEIRWSLKNYLLECLFIFNAMPTDQTSGPILMNCILAYFGHIYKKFFVTQNLAYKRKKDIRAITILIQFYNFSVRIKTKCSRSLFPQKCQSWVIEKCIMDDVLKVGICQNRNKRF